MSIVKSFSVGIGDMFYIKHNSSNFTIIDCYLQGGDKTKILNEIKGEKKSKQITRFISTHPDDDHIGGLKELDDAIDILNFYCVHNEATKNDTTADFDHYCFLRDSSKAFHLHKDCTRCWMNKDDTEKKYGSSGINILWPDTSNPVFKNALLKAKDGESPNNISPIIKYSLNNSATVLWMGDMETGFQEEIKNEVSWPTKVDILFAPHHGRDSGKIPESILKKMSPQIIIIGEADPEVLNYYKGYNTITQNSAGDITFECITNKIHIRVASDTYSVDFLEDEKQKSSEDNNYIGTLPV